MSDRSKLPKWAREEFERIENERDLVAAFRQTDGADPDVPVPEYGKKDVKGFLFNSFTRQVMHSISSSMYYGTNHLESGTCEKTTNQGTREQFSSKILAAKALRRAVEKDCAERLLLIDKMIKSFEAEEQKRD